MSVHSGKALLSSMSSAMFLLMLSKIGLRGKLQTFSGKMVNTVISDEEKGIQDKEGKEESILAMLGIIGTILNLVVIIFVYIYTTL
ncbi:protein TUNAR isoform X2 [Alosa pseudoharengus]|uniref:protein TUNAR isoform X2 n=1 Tax=Alosa pseudoharengus TaxID=34774 RepID=UPI003F8975C4